MVRILHGMLFPFLVAVSIALNPVIILKEMNLSQQNNYSFPQLGSYRINGKPPKGFESFYEFQINFMAGENQLTAKIDREGNLALAGAVLVRPGNDNLKVKVERTGELNENGEVYFVDVVKYKVKTSMLSLEGNRFKRIFFETEAVDGIKYSLKGEFLESPRLINGRSVDLVGSLAKFKGGQKIAEANLNFAYTAYE